MSAGTAGGFFFSGHVGDVVRALVLFAGALLLSSTASAQMNPFQPRITAGFSAGYDTNLPSSQENQEKESSRFYSMLLSGDVTWIATNVLALMLRGQVQGDSYDRFEELSNARALAMLRAIYKPLGGFYTPVLTGWVSAAKLEYGSEIRSGEEYRGGVFATLPLTTRIGLRGEIKGFHRQGEGRVFDQSGQSAVVGFNWALDPRLAANLSYEFQTGDSFSSGSPTLRLTRTAEVIEPDDAFGGLAGNQFAYRFRADTQVVAAGLNYRLTSNSALDAQVQAISVEADLDNRYYRMVGVFGILVRFR
ncbi:MAG: hypothetical protein ACT4QA_20825 [Panacagrimonas sp.]